MADFLWSSPITWDRGVRNELPKNAEYHLAVSRLEELTGLDLARLSAIYEIYSFSIGARSWWCGFLGGIAYHHHATQSIKHAGHAKRNAKFLYYVDPMHPDRTSRIGPAWRQIAG